MEKEKSIIYIKLRLLELALIICKETKEDIRKTYLELREEVLEIKNPND